MKTRGLAIGAVLLTAMCAPLPTATPTAGAQELKRAGASHLASVTLPRGAVRFAKKDVPKEVNEALATMMAAGGNRVRRGETEVLAWTGQGYSLKAVPRLKSEVGANLRARDWTYEEEKPVPGAGDITMISALKADENGRKALIGFWAPTKEALILAWTEMLPADTTEAEPPAEDAEPIAKPVAKPVARPDATIIEVSAGQGVVNVGKSLSAPRVTFSQLAPKPGKARGFVKSSDGKPLKGALIGVRSTAVGGAETGASAKTDARGYYEISVPWGAAGFYAAGYTAEYGDGLVALGLKPADGEADEFASPHGHVENWILAPHGIADRAAVQDDPKYVNNYFGGGLILYFHDENSMYGGIEKLAFGTVVEITLTPQGVLLDGSRGRAVTIRKMIRNGDERSLYVNNIPVGRYRFSVRADGRPLSLKKTGPHAAKPFGLEPKEARGETTLLLRPASARAESPVAGKGNWNSVDIDISG